MNITRRIAALLAACLLLGSVGNAAAVSFPDIKESDWYYAQMMRAAELGVINGVQEADGVQMVPWMELTWGQYLALLTRAFCGDDYRAALQSGLAWDAAGYYAAKHCESALLLNNDFLPVTEQTLGVPIARRDIAVLLERALPKNAESYHSSRGDREDVKTALSDLTDQSDGYRSAITRLYELEIINGKGDGTYGPYDAVHRCDGTVMLMRTLEYADRALRGQRMAVTLVRQDTNGPIIDEYPTESYVGESLYSLAVRHTPDNYDPVYADGSVSSACARYTLTFRPMSAAEIEMEEGYRRLSSGEISYEEFQMLDFWLRMPKENVRKHVLLFGDANKRRFANRAEAEANVVTVTVPLWRVRNGEKIAGSGTFKVHRAIADDVVAIFTEIFNDPERFPFNDVSGFAWRGDSATGEHNCGTAIDINPTQNAQIKNGRVLAGSYWKPGEDMFSITPEGSVVRIFAAHGWSWGGDAWTGDAYDVNNGNHDYMHFSYMGG